MQPYKSQVVHVQTLRARPDRPNLDDPGDITWPDDSAAATTSQRNPTPPDIPTDHALVIAQPTSHKQNSHFRPVLQRHLPERFRDPNVVSQGLTS